MKNTKMDLAQCPKSEYYSKKELINMIDWQVAFLRTLNPILDNAYIIKIESKQADFKKKFLQRFHNFNKRINLLNFEFISINHCYTSKNKSKIFLLMQLFDSQQDKDFVSRFIASCWSSKYYIQKLFRANNLGLYLDVLLNLKKKYVKQDRIETNFCKTGTSIINFVKSKQSLSLCDKKDNLNRQLEIIKNYENKYKETK